MKLHNNQLALIRHLIGLNIMAYADCLTFLDTENTGDRIAMSYAFRPLTKNGYLAKSRDGIVTVLQKGRELFPEEKPLISVATHGQGRNRVLQVSRVCMWMEKCGIPICDHLPNTEEPVFIPSACWRKIARGILSTTRFAGVLLAYEKRYAVYDIGDGTMDWQLRAESSLFYYKYGSFKTKADGMILICEDGNLGEYHDFVLKLYLYLSRLQWEAGEHDEAFASLDMALHHAKAYEAFADGEEHTLTAPLVRYVSSRAEPVHEVVKRLPDEWPFWCNPYYREIKAEMEADPRWTDWVRRCRE